MTRIAILEDFPLVRDAVSSALAQAGYQITGCYADPYSFLSRIDADRPDVAIIDIGLRTSPDGVDGLQVVRQLQRDAPSVRTIVYTGLPDPDLCENAYRSGASAFVDKLSAGAQALAPVVATVCRGGKIFPVGQGPLAPRPLPPRASELHSLTARELEVLEWVASGSDNLQIAAQLSITERTVKAHVSALYRKLEAGNRTQLALAAIKYGVVARPR